MDTKPLILKAKRITVTPVGDMKIVSVFQPVKSVIRLFQEAQGIHATVELHDETGMWSNGVVYEIDEVIVSEDERAMVVVLAQ